MKNKKMSKKSKIITTIVSLLVLVSAVVMVLKIQSAGKIDKMKNKKPGEAVQMTGNEVRKFKESAEKNGDKVIIQGGPEDNTGRK